LVSEPPPATGLRLEWQDLPQRVQTAVEGWLGCCVTSAVTQPTGFSPGVAARLLAADGRRVFVKAVGPEPSPLAGEIHRQEAQIVRELPPEAPVPRFLWSYDEGAGGWILLMFEDVDGRHPAQPWRGDELDRVAEMLIHLSADLTPSPVRVPSASEKIDRHISGWRLLRDAPPAGLDDWSARHLERLADLEETAPAAVAGETLLHLDVRADNLLLTPERVFLVDWPHTCRGAAWVDMLFFAPSVTMQGGPEPEALLFRHPAARAADPAAITAALAAVAGFFTHRALQPPPPGLPTVRAFQAAQGTIARRWLARRAGLE